MSVILVFNYTNHVVLISSLSTVNQYKYVTRHVSSMVAYRTCVLGVMDQNLVKSNIFFPAATMLLFYIVQRITIPKFCIFQKSITILHCMALFQAALVLIPPPKFLTCHVSITDCGTIVGWNPVA
jgi:hypothetical protein